MSATLPRTRIALGFGAFWVLCTAISAQNRAHWANVKLEGPLSKVVLDLGLAGSTRIAGELLAGETRSMRVPLPARSLSERVEPRIRTGAGEPRSDLDPLARGSVRFIGYEPFVGNRLDAIPASLRARARPAILGASVATSRATPFLLLAWLVIVLALRRRPALAILAASILSAALRIVVTAPDAGASSNVRVVDADVESDAWLQVDAALGSIVVPAEIEAFQLDVEPPGAPIVWHVALGQGAELRAESRGARLFLATVLEVAPARVTRAANHHAALDDSWLRVEGAWTHVGRWDQDAPLPSAAGEGAPPGWLAAGLPQGVTILIGAVHAPGRRPSWIRLSGL